MMRRWIEALSRVTAWVLQPLLVLGILVIGFLGARGLSSAREEPARDEAPRYAPLVEAIPAVRKTLPVMVRGHGTLEPRTRIQLVPQVGGEVIEVHPGLRAGGRFRAGEVLVRIEPLDYELAVARSRAEVSSAETALTTLTAESEAARAEWAILSPEEPVPALVAREPQIQEAQARLEAAQAQLESARLDLARTHLRLPFDGRVVSARTDVGEVLMANQSLGVVYATDRFEVPVPLRLEELAWLSLPGGDGGSPGSAARVSIDTGHETLTLTGELVRIEGQLDASTRLARAVLEVPIRGLDPERAEHVLPGSFVDVEFFGRTLEGAIELPRATLRADETLWIIDGGRLRFVPANLRHATGEWIYVEGFEPGTLVVTSNLEVVTDGMEIRLAEDAAVDAGASDR